MVSNIPSEAKISCTICKCSKKFRDLRKHYKTNHGYGRLTLECTIGGFCEMNWSCSWSLDCYIEHCKKQHGEFWIDGRHYKFEPFKFCDVKIDYESHSEICLIGKQKASNQKTVKSEDDIIRDQLRKVAVQKRRDTAKRSRKLVEPKV